MAPIKEKTMFLPLNFEPKDMLTICTYMFVFSITLSTLLITFSTDTELSRTYAAIIILMIGIPFGLCSLITSVALWRNSLKLWRFSKIWLVTSYLLLLIIILWVGISVFLGINLQQIASIIVPILGVCLPILFFAFGIWAELSRVGVAAQIMDAYFTLKTKTEYFDTILYVRSNGIYLDQELLFGYQTGQGFRPPRIQGYSKIAISEDELEASKIEKYVRGRYVILMIENKTLISEAVNTIKKGGGKPVGCVIASTEPVSETFLQEIRSELRIPIEGP